MVSANCPAKDNPDAVWPPMCPNVGAAYFFAILFALVTVAHITQAIIYRKAYSWVIVMSSIWQSVAYIFRILSIRQVDNQTWYIAWFLLILLAPLWINAYVYMVMGRMIFNYTTRAKIFGVKAWRFGLFFVLLDILAFLIQAGGASAASGEDKPRHAVMRGLHIYMGGIGVQQFFIFCFVAVAVRFHNQMKRDLPSSAARRQATTLLYIVYATLTLITVRIIFRLIEYAEGFESRIPEHEEYQYVFDTSPMFIALVLFNIVHPGRVMAGKEADFPSRKERKAAGKDHVWGRANKQMGGEGIPLHEPARSLSPDAKNPMSL